MLFYWHHQTFIWFLYALVSNWCLYFEPAFKHRACEYSIEPVTNARINTTIWTDVKSNAVTTQNAELLFNIPTEASSSVGGRWTGYMYMWPPTWRVWSGSGILRELVTIWLRLCTKAQCLVWASAADYLNMILHKWVPNSRLKLDSLVNHWTSMLTNVYMIGIPRVYSIQISPKHV